MPTQVFETRFFLLLILILLAKKTSLKNETFKQELLLVHGKKNTLIILDGKIVYNSLPTDIEVSQSRLHRYVADHKKKQVDDFVLKQNKRTFKFEFGFDFKKTRQKNKK